jgi:plastocyanin
MATAVRVLALCVLLLSPAILVGCGDITSAESAPVKTDTVNLPPSYKFAPAAIEVEAGTTVTWTNNDHFTHSVKVDGLDDEVHNIPKGESISITFDAPGEYNYICTYHPKDMKGKVYVTSP